MLHIASVVLVRFNPATYTVTEGVDSNAVITLETIGAHPDVINVTVIARNGSATREFIYAAYEFSYWDKRLLMMTMCLESALLLLLVYVPSAVGVNVSAYIVR